MEDKLKYLIEKDLIIGQITTLFKKINEKDWQGVKTCLADQVLFDISSMKNTEPEKITKQELITRWDKGLKEIEKIHHQSGNYRVKINKNEAEVHCHAIVFHYKNVRFGESTRRFVGSYDFHLIKIEDDWKIDKFKFNLKFIEGNVNM